MNIQDVWHSFHGERVPIAYLLRKQTPGMWFRIHSLPESKRYAENEEEMQEILRRHNCIATEALREGSECIWFIPNYALQKYSTTFSAFSGDLFCHYEDDHTEVALFAAFCVWQSERFDAVLRLVADDQIRYISWMSIESGQIFAPYDGGADLFLNSIVRRDELRERFSDWLSKHPEGV